MIQTDTARRAQALLGVAVRRQGADSLQARAARRTFRAARTASYVLDAHAELGGFTPAERALILAALDGHEKEA